MKKQHIKQPTQAQRALGTVSPMQCLARIGVALAATGACSIGWAQVTTPAYSVSASATVASTLTISSATTLGFGTFVPDTSAGTVVIAPQSTGFRSKTGNISLLDSGAGTPSTVSVSGAPNMTFSVNLPTSSVNLTGPSGNVMSVSSFTSSIPTGTKGTIGTGGAASFLVGATLNVAASQVAGTYSGSFNVTVSYP